MPAATLLGTALALLAGCDTAPKVSAPVAAAPVETRRPLATPAAATPPAATATATPQSSVATIDLAKNAAPGSVAGAAATGSRPATAATPAATAAVASTAMMAMPTQRVVYFDFDSYAIKDDFKATIDAYARVLQANRGKKLVVEGHTDERGGREYNLALGQKRAAAVVSSLTLLGATEAQLEAVSFGEERPVAQGNDEAAWAKNRRAELKDR
jgi:peptidoglycan-associated lipoprotein